MLSLKKLILIKCSFHEQRSFGLLGQLTNLEELSLVQCENITERHLHKLQDLPKLRSLTVSKCRKVSSGLLASRAVQHCLHFSMAI